MADTKTGQYSHIMDGLRFPNGIELSSDGKSILLVETMKLRILRIPSDGGEVTVFSDGLPGVPDNIKASPRGGYWVPVSNLRDEPLSVLLFNYLPAYPCIRQLASNVWLLIFLYFLYSIFFILLSHHFQILWQSISKPRTVYVDVFNINRPQSHNAIEDDCLYRCFRRSKR